MDGDGLMTEAKAAARGLPAGLQWFAVQRGAVAAADADGGVVVAHDCTARGGGVVKAFAVVGSHEALVDLLLSAAAEGRQPSFYEMIREERGCKPYLDVERMYEGRSVDAARDAFLPDLRDLMAAFCRELSRGAGCAADDVELCVVEGSRMKNNGADAKVSFHVVATNVLAASNCDGELKAIACKLKARWSAVDDGVYSKNRQFRCPFAAKLGDTVTLVPRRDLSTAAMAALDDRGFTLASLVTCCDDAACLRLGAPAAASDDESKKRVREDDDNGPKKKKKKKKKCKGGGSGEVQRGLQALLRLCGDMRTVVQGWRQTEEGGDERYACANDGERVCLLDQEGQERHTDNNCMLFVSSMDAEGSTLVVRYCCMSPSCAAKTLFHNNSRDMGVLIREAAGGYRAIKGASAADRARLGLAVIRAPAAASAPAPPPPPSFLHALLALPQESEADHLGQTIGNPQAGSIVNHLGQAIENPALSQGRWEEAQALVGVLHVYDKRVMPALASVAARDPSRAEAYRRLFARYYDETILHNAARPPPCWGVWEEAVAAADGGQEQAAMQQLKDIAAAMELECARKYARGVLLEEDSARATGALNALGEKYIERQQTFTGDFVRLMPCRASADVIPPGDGERPIDVLRAIYVKNESYGAVRDQVDRRFAFDVRSAGVIELVSAAETDDCCTGLATHTQDHIAKALRKVKYADLDAKTGAVVRKAFVNTWLDDEHGRTFTRQCVDPSRVAELKPGVFNRWGGLLAEYEEPIPQAVAEALVAPVVQHIRDNWANGDEGVCKFVLDWFAHLVQRPGEKTKVSIVVFGAEGTGKSIIPKFIRERVMGESCSVHTANPGRDVFGKHTTFIRDAVLVQVDEVTNMRRFMDELKDMITGATLTFEEKFMKIERSRNFSNFIFTTNDPGAFQLDAVNRRMVLLHCNDNARFDSEFFRALVKAMEHPQAGRAMYQVLMARDLSHIGATMQFVRPITEFHRGVVQASLPPVAVLLSALVNTEFPALASGDDGDEENTMFSVTVTSLHEASTRWTGLWGQREDVTINRFGAKIGEYLDCSLKKRRSHGMMYEMCKADIRAALDKRRSFVEDVSLPTDARASLTLRPI